jgi:predicted DNA binding CopG/RHH family protein
MLTRFEIKPKGKSINLRLSGELYDVPSQRFIRLTLEQAIESPK